MGAGWDVSKFLQVPRLKFLLFPYEYPRVTENFELLGKRDYFSFAKVEHAACGICWDYSTSSASGISASWGALYSKPVNTKYVALKGCRTRQEQQGL